MSDQTNVAISKRWMNEGIISAISIGLVFVLIGAVFVINQNLFSRIVDFFRDFLAVPVGNIGNAKFFLPAPDVPANHTYVYAAASQFALGVGLIDILTLALRISLGSRVRKTAETVGDLVFWFGAAYLLNSLSNMSRSLALSQQREMWFLFWSAIIMLAGVSLIVRAIILFMTRRRTTKTAVA